MSDLIRRLKRLEQALRPKKERPTLIVFSGDHTHLSHHPTDAERAICPQCRESTTELRQLKQQGGLDAPMP